MARPAEAGSEAGSGRALARAALLLALLVAAGFAARLVGAPILAHPAANRGGAAALFLAGGLACAAGVPRQVVAFAGGYAFGFWPGTALALAAQMLGCGADFWLARTLARGWATRRLRASGRLAQADRFLAAHPFTATLTLRLLPVGNNVALNLMAGVSAMAAWPFLAASLLGYVPQSLVFALAGSGVQLDRGHRLAVAGALFVASTGLGLWLLKARPRA